MDIFPSKLPRRDATSASLGSSIIDHNFPPSGTQPQCSTSMATDTEKSSAPDSNHFKQWHKEDIGTEISTENAIHTYIGFYGLTKAVEKRKLKVFEWPINKTILQKIKDIGIQSPDELSLIWNLVDRVQLATRSARFALEISDTKIYNAEELKNFFIKQKEKTRGNILSMKAKCDKSEIDCIHAIEDIKKTQYILGESYKSRLERDLKEFSLANEKYQNNYKRCISSFEFNINTADELIHDVQSFLNTNKLSDQELSLNDFYSANVNLQRNVGQIVRGVLKNINCSKLLEDAIKLYGVHTGDDSERQLRQRIKHAQSLPTQFHLITEFAALSANC